MRIVLVSLLCSLAGAACGGGSSSPDAGIDARAPAGTFSLSWVIMEGATPKTCTELGNPSVTISAVPVAGGSDQRDTFSCSSMMATSRGFPPGGYRVTVSLGQIGSVGPMMATIEDGQDTPLGQITFDVVANGGVSFKLAVAGASGNNCDPETMNDGGGIDDMVLELWDGNKTACIASTFTVGTDSYTSDCTGNPHFRCIEKDELITVGGLVTGSYYIRIAGYEGAALCYPYDALVSVPAGGSIHDVGTITLPLMDPAPGDSEPLCQAP